ncbi:MAG: thiopeptide-type bacteriocin biosynthesis protein, partial [Methylotenera sp.]|nr:thiopeptide-type bacteriocin biosynthesis protein [Methylotenera sp.]
KWFFLRYADPQFHIRWRIGVPDAASIGYIAAEIKKAIIPYVDNDLIYKVQVDTYKREIERYGSNSIEIIEHLFWQNSLLVYDYLNQVTEDPNEKVRWLYSMRAIDSFLNSFNYELEKKLELLTVMANSYGKEHNINSALINQLSDRYRSEKKEIYNFMRFEIHDINDYTEMLHLINMANERSVAYTQKILKLAENNSLMITLDNLMISCIHMFMNRIFRSRQRLHEMVIYGFLFRYYRSQLAQSKHYDINA